MEENPVPLEETKQSSFQSPSGPKKVNQNLVKPNLDEQGFRHTAINRVVGMSDAASFYTQAENDYAEPIKDKQIIEKNSEQGEICDAVFVLLPNFLKSYGLEEPVVLKSNRVNIYDLSDLSNEEREKDTSMAYRSDLGQRILFNGDKIKEMSQLMFAHVLAHEAIHLESFTSFTAVDEVGTDEKKGKILVSRRSGLVSYKQGKTKEGEVIRIEDYFAVFNEAITEIIARNFISKYKNQVPHVGDDIQAIRNKLELIYKDEKIKNPGKRIQVRDAETSISTGDENPELFLRRKGKKYEHEIDELERVIQRIFEAKKDKYGWEDPDEVFLEFTKAYFTGKVLTLARIIKEVYPDIDLKEVGKVTRLNFKDDKNPAEQRTILKDLL